MSEKRLDIYVCTRSKCTAKQVTLCVRAGEARHDYNGPALLAALTQLVRDKAIDDRVTVHEATCMSGCPVGPRMDLCSGSQRVMYFRRLTPTGRDDLVTWTSIESVEREIETHLSEKKGESSCYSC
ncbi:MAG TPA: (2Fe-2S) ferredoxin domain-containing protein [Candidatus Binatia bacterium]|jgi:predicted metal-binding protein|nr:(2Fe-2S) ferredoxin domain-containing protein [Candidatus Binatia bacterium]